MKNKKPIVPAWLFDPAEVEHVVYLLEQRHPLADMQPVIEPLEQLLLTLESTDVRQEVTLHALSKKAIMSHQNVIEHVQHHRRAILMLDRHTHRHIDLLKDRI